MTDYISTRAASATIEALREELTVAQARVAELEQLQANLVTLVIRLSRRVRGFDNECKVRKQCLEYLSKNGLMPSVLRENENE